MPAVRPDPEPAAAVLPAPLDIERDCVVSHVPEHLRAPALVRGHLERHRVSDDVGNQTLGASRASLQQQKSVKSTRKKVSTATAAPWFWFNQSTASATSRVYRERRVRFERSSLGHAESGA